MSFWRSELIKVIAQLKERQPLSGALTSWAVVVRASGFDAFAATSSSANFQALLTDETGTGKVVFSDQPTFTTGIVVPLVTGGTAAGSSLSLKSTAASGTTDFIRLLTGNGVEIARFLTNGQLIFNSTSAVTVTNETGGSYNPLIQVQSTGGDNGFSSFRWSNNATPSRVAFAKSRGTSIGTRSIVQSGDGLGGLLFGGDDGTNFIPAAFCGAYVDGTPGTNDMPGRVVIATTADGAAAVTERLRIDKDGVISHRANVQVIIDANSLLCLRLYTVATVPSASVASKMIYVSDGTANKRIAVSDGTNWRFPDGNIVS